MEIMKTSSSLSDLLNKNAQLLETLDYEMAEAILGVLDMIGALMSRLTLVLQSKYKSLKHTKSAAELIFEFPNNIRHTCTTMPWTILPALIVLWGVCWMFIIGSHALDHESLTPIFSPTPAANEVFDASFTTDPQSRYCNYFMPLANVNLDSDPSTALFDFDDQDSLNSLFYSGAADHTTNPLDWANGSPLDPNFLTAGIVSDDQLDLNELGIIHGSVVEAQSNGLLHGNDLPNPESSGRYVSSCKYHRYRTRVDLPDVETVKRARNVLYVPPANDRSRRSSPSSDIKHTPTAIWSKPRKHYFYVQTLVARGPRTNIHSRGRMASHVIC